MTSERAVTLGEQAASWISSQLPEMEKVLAELVDINSFTDNVEGGRKVAVKLDAFFESAGLSTEVIPSRRYADHRVYRSKGDGSTPLALVGHYDTVFPPGKFEGYRVDGDLRRGPGVLDMKGGLVVIGFALKALKEVGLLDLLPPITCVVVADEEVGSPEGQGVIRNAIAKARACLVFEAGRQQDAIVTTRKGTGALTVKAHGKAAHAGNAHAEGANAIWALSRFIDRAQGLTDYGRGVTVNVGKIGGGQGKNTVPDQAEAVVDLRFSTRVDAQALLANLDGCAKDAAEGVPGTRVELIGGIAREPLEASDASRDVMRAYAACAKRSGLGHSEAPLSGGGSDANTASAMGIPSIDGLGPRGKGFHTVDEFIEVGTLVSKTQALARYLATLAE